MQTPRKTIFISDLHLAADQPEIAEIFLKLLSNHDANIDAFYILGDLFDAWIGDDDVSSFHCNIQQALKAVTSKGMPIYFLPGNRDFLIGKQFLQTTGCTLLADEEKINLYQVPVLLMHGDTLCTQDTAYLKWRKIAHNSILQRIFLLLPLALRRSIANKMRKKSRYYTQLKTMEIMDVSLEAVSHVMEKHRVNYLIHGHTHRPSINDFYLNQVKATRIVLAAWHQQGHMLVWQQSGEKNFLQLPGPTPLV